MSVEEADQAIKTDYPKTLRRSLLVSELTAELDSMIESRLSGCQQVEWFPDRWMRVFEVTPFFDDLLVLIPRGQSLGSQAYIKREQIYEKRNEDLFVTFLATMIWGRGPDNRGPKLTLRMMNRAGFDDIIQDLASHARSSQPQEAFRALISAGRPRLPRLGVSFGTKVLHAFGYKESGVQPLVYDVFVFRALRSLHEDGAYPYDPQHPWRFMTGESYGMYCAWAEEKAQGLGAEPADVECALFQLGRNLSRQSR